MSKSVEGAAARRKPGSALRLLPAFLSAMVLAFLYGVASTQLEIFPYSIMRDAKNALEAVMKLEEDELPTGVINPHKFAAQPAPEPVVSALDPGAGAEALLITGGFYQNMARCPQFGCIAWIADRQGEILHSWEVDPALLTEGVENFDGLFGPDAIYPIGLALAGDGTLTVSFHNRNSFPYQTGVARFAADGSLLWKVFDHSHHWFDVDAEGRSFLPSAEYVPVPEYIPGTVIKTHCAVDIGSREGVRIFDADGNVEKDIWIEDSFWSSGWPGLLYSKRDDCDPAHVNSVQLVTPDIAAQLPGVDPGDLLVSVREPGAVVVLDVETGAVIHAVAGRTAGQHGPQFLPDGTVVVFDNQGNPADLGGARIVRMDLTNGDTETVYPAVGAGPEEHLYSPDGGHVSVSPDGARIMISAKHEGRMIEVDVATGKRLWQMDKCFELGRYKALKKAEGEQDNACFSTYGTYYVTDLDFIDG